MKKESAECSRIRKAIKTYFLAKKPEEKKNLLNAFAAHVFYEREGGSRVFKIKCPECAKYFSELSNLLCPELPCSLL